MKTIELNFSPFESDILEDLPPNELTPPEDLVFIFPSLSIPQIGLKQDFTNFQQIVFKLEEFIENIEESKDLLKTKE